MNKDIEKLFQECIDYIKPHRANKKSVVCIQNMFHNMRIEGNKLLWDDMEGEWNITFNGFENASSINWLDMGFRPYNHYSTFNLSHMQHGMMIMGIITAGIDKVSEVK